MESSAPSSSNNFSAIARRLLLSRQAREDPTPVVPEKIQKCEEIQTQPLPVHTNTVTPAERSQSRNKAKRIIVPFSSEENRYLISSFLDNYDEYYGYHSPEATRSALRNIKIRFLEKWAEELTALRGRKRTPSQVFEKVKKSINTANHYIKALKKYQACEISQLPPLQSYLEPLVAKILEEEQLKFQGLSRNLSEDFDDLMPMDDSPPPDEIESLAASSSIDDGNGRKAECSKAGKKANKIKTVPYSAEENRYLVSRFLENYDEYHHFYSTKTSRIDLRFIKDRFHKKWAEELSALGHHKRTPPKVYDRIRNYVTTVKDYIKAMNRYNSGTLPLRPQLPSHLEPLVSKVKEHEQLKSRLSGSISNDYTEVMPMDNSPPPDNIDDLLADSLFSDEHSVKAECSEEVDKTGNNKTIPFSAEENRYLASRLLENYNDYYGCYLPEPSKLHVRMIKNRYHQKWAEELTALGRCKRTSSQVFEKIIKYADMLRNYVTAVQKYHSGERSGSLTQHYLLQLPRLPAHLKPLVSKVWKHEQFLSRISGKLPNGSDGTMPMDDSPPPYEIGDRAASSSSDGGHDREILFAPLPENKTASETSVVNLPTDDQESKPPAEQPVILQPGSESKTTAEEPVVYLPPNDEETKPPPEQHAASLLQHDVDDEVPAGTPAFDSTAEELLDVKLPDDDMSTFGSEDSCSLSGYSDQSDFGFMPEEQYDIKPPGDEVSAFGSEDGNSANESAEQASFSTAVVRPQLVPPKVCHTSLCVRLRRLSVERLKAINSDISCRPSLGSKTKVMIRRVRQFFEEIKKILGDSCEGTIFASTVELTAWACGVTPDTVTRIGTKSEFVHELIPRAKKRVTDSNREREMALKKHGDKWGDVIRDFVANRIPKDHQTTLALHAELRRSFVDFKMSTTTLKYLLHGLGVKFVKDHGKQIMVFET